MTSALAQRIVLIGDSVLADPDLRFDEVLLARCRAADAVLVNVEAPITEAPFVRGRGRPLATGPHTVRLLQELSVTVALLANNHVMDHGVRGLVDTQRALAAAGIHAVGAGTHRSSASKPTVVGGPRAPISVLAFAHREGPMLDTDTAGPLPLPSFREVARRVYRLKAAGHRVIFSYHGGEEHFGVPWPRRRAFLRRVSELGVDIVFGHHSHSIQPIELVDGRVIVYSPGNFVMHQPREPEGTARGQVVEVDLQARRVRRLTVHYDKSASMLRVIDDVEMPLNSNVELDADAYVRQWVAECRAKLSAPEARRLGYPAPRLMTPVLAARLVVQGRRGRQSRRNIDILGSALPLAGPAVARATARGGGRRFSF
jgi:hypothetical protein